jgi:hypothetical protein
MHYYVGFQRKHARGEGHVTFYLYDFIHFDFLFGTQLSHQSEDASEWDVNV